MSNRNNRNNRYTAIPEVRDDLQSLATAVRALKQTVEVLSRQSGSEDDWAATVADVTNAVTTATNAATNNTDWSQLLNDPTIDIIFDRAAAKADRLAQDTRDEARIALAKLQTAFDNFRNGYVDDNAVIKASVTQLEASVEENTVRISSEELVRLTATQALAGRIDTVSAQTLGSIAAVTNEVLALSGPTGAIATQINAVTTASTNAKTYIQSTMPQSLATNAYWVDLNGATPVVKQWTGSAWATRTATIAATAPSSPVTNALWFDTTTSLLKRWSGTAWVTQAAFVQSRTPAVIAVGDLWLDTTQANALKEWNGTSWVTVENVDSLGVLLSTLVTESISKTDGDRTTATRIDNLISLAPDGNSATINNTQLTTATRTEALASDLTDLEVQTTGGSAGGFYRLLASASPADGALAEFQIQVRAAQSGANSTYSTAGMRIQAMSNGTSRVKFNTDQFIIANSTNTYTPFAVTSGQLAVNALVDASKLSGQLTTTQINGLGAFATLSKIPAASAATYIDNLAVTSALIADSAIVNAKIGDAEVTNAKIANATIQTAKIADAAITTAKIGDLTVTTAKIADLTVGNEKITASAVSRTVYAQTSSGSLTGGSGNYYYTVDARATLLTRQDINSVKSRVFISTYTNGWQVAGDSSVEWSKVQIWSEAGGTSTLLEEVTMPADMKTGTYYSGSPDGIDIPYSYIIGSPSYNLQIGLSNPPVGAFPILVRLQIYSHGLYSTSLFTRLPIMNFMAWELAK